MNEQEIVCHLYWAAAPSFIKYILFPFYGNCNLVHAEKEKTEKRVEGQSYFPSGIRQLSLLSATATYLPFRPEGCLVGVCVC